MKLKNKIISTLAIGVLGVSLFGASGEVQAKHYNKVDSSFNPVIKECRLVISKNSSYKNRDYGTGEVDICYTRSGFYDKELKLYTDMDYFLTLKDGDIYDDWTTASYGYYMRVHYFIAEKYTSAVKANDVSITNNKVGKKDTIEVANLQKNDVVKVYTKRNKVTYVANADSQIATGKSKGSKLTLSVSDLGKNAGSVYVTVKRGKLNESFTRKISFKKESDKAVVKTTLPLSSKNVTITNNKNKYDTIQVRKLVKKQKISIYDNKGKLLTSKSSTGKTVTLKVKQLGKKSGYLYLARQVDGKKTSQKIKMKFKAEK
ncbi:hypothetical protein ACQKND_16135 [Viridibacillus arvi]|uniref:hypothetical protein n=1 Tax=Viridibacillus arvi TaxID=263475 RepID=UPI003D04F5C6